MVAPYALMSAINLIGALLTPTYPTLYLVGSSISDEAGLRLEAQFDGDIGRIAETSKILGTFKDQRPFKVIEADEFREHLILRTPSCPKLPRTKSTRYQNFDSTAKQAGRIICTVITAMDEPAERMHLGTRPYERPLLDGFSLGLLTLMNVCFVFGAFLVAIVGGLSGFHPGQSTKAQRVCTMMWLVFGVIVGPGVVGADKFLDSRAKYKGSPDDSNSNSTSRNGAARVVIATALLYGVLAIGGFVVVGKMLFEYGSCVILG
ncbi:hypothetical protein BD779DRAFT_1677858 [Infundibulicybe gibba]|nr:hypothetical protein BD779DRAFT_1677858 [Infundibulicybe gibba]